MLIDTFQIKSVTPNILRIEWFATDLLKTCWVYSNGILINKITDISTINRALEFSIDPNESCAIEIHEVSSDEDVKPINIKRSHYEARWNRVDDACYYLIYHSVESETEALLQRIEQIPNRIRYYWEAPVLEWLDGVWHHFKIESVNSWEKHSTTKLWHYFVYGMPSFPSSVEITGSSNIFDLNLVF